MYTLEEKYYITSTTDTKGIITSVSPAFCKISGYTQEELLGQPHNIVRHPDMPSDSFKNLWETISAGNTWSAEVKNKKKDGGFYWVDSTVEPMYDDDSNIIGYKSIRFNISDTKELQEKYEQNKILLQEIEHVMQIANSGIAFIDRESTFLEVNPYIELLFGCTKTQMLQKKFFDLIADEFKEQNLAVFQKARETNVAQKLIAQLNKKDGSSVWIEIIYDDFDVNKILVTIKDIEIYKELEQKNKLLLVHSKNAAMGEMLAMIAHQWRQPLTTIVTILSKMQIKNDLGAFDKEEFKSDFTKVKNLVQHLSTTIEDFQDYFKEKKGSFVSLKKLFMKVNTILEPLFKNYEIHFTIENFDLDYKLDDRLDQVLLNIYQNAIDALKEKDHSSLGNRSIVTTFDKDGDEILIRIFDNGGGISENIMEKVFTPYFSTKSKNGSGLGLYMSRDIVENHIKGTLSVYNKNDGACFEIKVPVIE